MNDSSELTDARAIFGELLDVETQSQFPKLWPMVRLLAESVTWFPVDYFVTCFCEKDDLLSQWRGYGSQGGFCLGLRTQGFLLPGDTATRLRRVEYNRDRKVQRMREQIKIVLKHLGPVADQLQPGTVADLQILKEFMFRVAGSFVGLFCEMKNEAFKDEEEWRLICTQPSALLGVRTDVTKPIEFRVSDSSIVPYVRLRWPGENGVPTLPVALVRCGPGPRPELSKWAVLDLLACTGFRDVAVEGSNVPLRV